MGRFLVLLVGMLMATPAWSIDLDSLPVAEIIEMADYGNPEAQVYLAVMLANGRGLNQDQQAAVYWWRRAALQGNPFGQGGLGVAYANGRGVPMNYVTAYMWYNLAAANHIDQFFAQNGARLRDDLASRMTRMEVSEAQRRSRVCFNSNYQNCD